MKDISVLLASADCGYLLSQLLPREFIIRKRSSNDFNSDIPRDSMLGSTFPGTLWCGPGNTARNRTDLGPLRTVDACCRAHDECGDVIPRFSTKNDLFNPTMSPKYDCKCDQSFKECLRRVPNRLKPAAEFIGGIYFESDVFPNCFTYDYPKKCVDRSKSYAWRCAKYFNINSENRKKIWQWMDFGSWFIDITSN